MKVSTEDKARNQQFLVGTGNLLAFGLLNTIVAVVKDTPPVHHECTGVFSEGTGEWWVGVRNEFAIRIGEGFGVERKE